MRYHRPAPDRSDSFPCHLIDATYAALISHSGDALVVPALNRDGDCLSDMVLPLFGSIAGSESVVLAFDENFKAAVAMAEAPHGTAPTLQGKNVANPLGMILAAASVLSYMPGEEFHRASRAFSAEVRGAHVFGNGRECRLVDRARRSVE